MIEFNFDEVDTIDSTNDELTREVESGKLKKDKILIARHQTNGHGTKGRTFISEKDVGIYFTFLHFYKDASELSFLTQKVAVAIYNVFKSIFDIEFTIKWVNDIYYKDKKVCGILCRNLMNYKAVIMGVGIDLFYNKDIDESIKDIAGFIFKDKMDLITHLENNKKLPKESCVYKNIYDDFKTLRIDGIDIDDSNMWEASHLVVQIAMNIMHLIKIEGLPKLYVEKNIVKDDRVYEDCEL